MFDRSKVLKRETHIDLDPPLISARISIYLLISPASIPLSASIPLFFDGGAGILYLRPHTDH